MVDIVTSNMRIIEINEQHVILLEMAKELHGICKRNGIPYYMLGGTMLGAIRHKGFIPWDDDMDFGIPRNFYDKFVECAQKELNHPYKILTVNTSDYAIIGIGKISNSITYVPEDFAVETTEKLGINIDVFPLDYTDSNIGVLSTNRFIRNLFRFQKLLFLDASKRSFGKRILANTCKVLFNIKKQTIVEYIHNKMLTRHLNNPTKLANLYGAWGMKEVVDVNVMGQPQLYAFENTELYGVEKPDLYLRQLYGDYMKLPPDENRHVHASNSYYL